MDYTVHCGRDRGQPGEVVEIAEVHLGALLLQFGGGVLGAGEADDLVPVRQEFGDDGGTEVAGGPGDQYAHGEDPFEKLDVTW
ncbi:hypothetical protein GCM10017566_18070 [Amycolatopsis bartoniae]|uniref:Uncharacterized protein n=1 Tax=Amycolatopsis bartoniae TaxID=941986 RepID=A0A8H9MA08_9PSEU|nr:hypothetical protein GCM10017566_18070 [Amycolatopsis bartoniae]